MLVLLPDVGSLENTSSFQSQRNYASYPTVTSNEHGAGSSDARVAVLLPAYALELPEVVVEVPENVGPKFAVGPLTATTSRAVASDLTGAKCRVPLDN